MEYIKKFENFNSNEINIIIDISASIPLQEIIEVSKKINCDYCSKINIALVDSDVRVFKTISDLSDLPMLFKSIKFGNGSDLQKGIDYIVDKNLNNNKTYIISDLLVYPLDYSKLSEYEELELK